MKRLLSLSLLAILFNLKLYAQAPPGINYQGVARDAEGKAIVSKQISVRISILKNSADGDTEYRETHSISTNAFGLFTLVIGRGNVNTGTFDFISWAVGNKWLQIELDPNGGNSFQLMGSQQLMSVPYAFYAKYSGNGLIAGQGINITNGVVNNTGDADNNASNELNTSLTLGSDHKLKITDAGGTKEADLSSLMGSAQNLSSVLTTGNDAGGSKIANLATPTLANDAATKTYVDTHQDGDANSANEIQDLNFTGSTLRITNNATATPVDLSGFLDNTDNQNLNISGNTLSLTNDPSTVDLSGYLDNTDSQNLSLSGNTLSLTNDGTPVDLSAYGQTLSKTGANITLTIANGSGGGTVALNDDSGTNEAQTISRTGSTVTLTQVSGIGGGTFSIDDADANATNEVQTISRTGSNVTLTQVSGTGGGTFSIDDADANATNEAQSISLSGNTLTLSQISGTGGGSITVDTDPANELQNLSQVLAKGADANNTRIQNVATPIANQDAVTKQYVDAADANLASQIATTYAFKTAFSYTNTSGFIENAKDIPFTIEEFDDFNVIGANIFIASETGTYVFTVDGIHESILGAGAQLSLYYNGIKYPFAIIPPWGGGAIARFNSTLLFKLTVGQSVSLIADNILIGGKFSGSFFGFKL